MAFDDLKVSLIARVPFQSGTGKTGFKFIDCQAELHLDGEDPAGYEPGSQSPTFSTVTGLIGGGTEVNIYPAQFGLTVEPGTCVHFLTRPDAIVNACIQAVREGLFAPEYEI